MCQHNILWALLIAGLTVSCLPACQLQQPPRDEREAFVHNALLEDNQVMLERDPIAVGGKFAKMSTHLYNYFRGTASLYVDDMTQATSPVIKTAYGTASSGYIATLMDPHPENIGTYLGAKDTLFLDFNDFDGARYAPYHFDVRRLALGFCALLLSIEDADAKAYTKTISEAVVRGYIGQIIALKQQTNSLLQSTTETDTIVVDLLRRAEKDGLAQEELSEYTAMAKGKRSMRFGVVTPSFRVDIGNGQMVQVMEDETTPVSDDEQRLLQALHANYLAARTSLPGNTPAHFQVKGWARRLGSGISSYPRLRYYALIEGPTQKPDDDLLLEFKELTDPPQIQGLEQFPRRAFTDNASRVVWLQEQMQATRTNDRYLGTAFVEPMAFRVRWRTKYQKNFSVLRFTEKYQEAKWTLADLRDFARYAGMMLANAHARAQTLDERRGREIIIDALGDHPEEFVQETIQFTAHYAKQLEADFQRFKHLLKTHGVHTPHQIAPNSSRWGPDTPPVPAKSNTYTWHTF